MADYIANPSSDPDNTNFNSTGCSSLLQLVTIAFCIGMTRSWTADTMVNFCLAFNLCADSNSYFFLFIISMVYISVISILERGHYI